ncbi:MAG: protein kinase [candidate division Zixibacteria bacterium]|nr:protein kinase [candidate division Zixibacteria bacterium]
MLETGQNLGHFTILKKLGAGGMGEVYLAKDTKLQRNVAIKTLLAEFFEDKERKERFQREARTAAKINHQNVMGIYDIDTAIEPQSGKEFTYIVMEYIEGQSLTQFLAAGEHDISELAHIAEHIAGGLAAAHQINVVHRDIKAGNIIIDKDNIPKILDFGLAKPVVPQQLDDDADSSDTISQELTKVGKIVGTISYMSPEQINGEPVDNRSDIFAIGTLLYRMFTGSAPFEGDTQVSTMAKILESQPESPHVKNDSIPPELERIIEKCLRKNPNDRYQDTRDLVVDLRDLRRQYDSEISSSISTIRQLQKNGSKPSSHFTPKTIIAFIATSVVLFFLIWAVIDNTQSSHTQVVYAGENGLAILGFENKTGDEELNWLQTGLPEILQTDLAQSDAITIISRDRVVECIKGGEPHPGFGHPHKECLKAANFLGAKYAISGTFYKLGDKIRIDSRLVELGTGKIISTVKVVGDNPFVLVDSLTDKIASSLDLGQEFASATDVSSVTSSSPEAYKKYLEAMKVFNLAMYAASIEEFEKAIALDSTFALPYMRIAMAYVFTGQNTNGAIWFKKAAKYSNRLPIRDKNLLDVYSDMWLEQNFDDAFIKLETLVNNYPDDVEMRTIFALLVNLFRQDTTTTYAHFDTVLQISPNYLFCLSILADQRMNLEQYDLAKEYADQIKKHYPESPTSYQLLASIYRKEKNFDLAIENYTKQYEVYPRGSSALFNLYRLHIYKRDFEKAEEYVNRILAANPGDAFETGNYYDYKASLALWKGQFRNGLNYFFKGLNHFIELGDSNLIQSSYSVISELYFQMDMVDSSLFYTWKGYKWSKEMGSRVVYPFRLISRDSTLIDTARTIMAGCVKAFRTKLPEEFWPIGEDLNDIFEASFCNDTAAMIEAQLRVYNANPSSNRGVLRTIALLHSKTGKYQEAIDQLDSYLTDNTASSSGLNFVMSLYHLGISYEGIGNTDKAIDAYEKIINIWPNPDYEIDEYKDTKKRLAALTS